jgi:hypothetical protein
MNIQGTLTEVWSSGEHIFKSWTHARKWLDCNNSPAVNPERKHAFVSNSGDVYLIGLASIAKPIKFTNPCER